MSDREMDAPGHGVEMTTEEREQKLVALHAQLSAAMLQRGMDRARIDTPDEFRRATELHAAGAGHFQLRIDVDERSATTSGWLIDDAGEPLMRIFETRAIIPAKDWN